MDTTRKTGCRQADWTLQEMTDEWLWGKVEAYIKTILHHRYAIFKAMNSGSVITQIWVRHFLTKHIDSDCSMNTTDRTPRVIDTMCVCWDTAFATFSVERFVWRDVRGQKTLKDDWLQGNVKASTSQFYQACRYATFNAIDRTMARILSRGCNDSVSACNLLFITSKIPAFAFSDPILYGSSERYAFGLPSCRASRQTLRQSRCLSGDDESSLHSNNMKKKVFLLHAFDWMSWILGPWLIWQVCVLTVPRIIESLCSIMILRLHQTD